MFFHETCTDAVSYSVVQFSHLTVDAILFCMQGCCSFHIWLKTKLQATLQAAFLMLSSLYIFTDKYKLKWQSDHWSLLVDKVLVHVVAILQIRSGSGRWSKMTIAYTQIMCLRAARTFGMANADFHTQDITLLDVAF